MVIRILITMGHCSPCLAGHEDKQERCQDLNPIYPQESVGKTLTCWGDCSMPGAATLPRYKNVSVLKTMETKEELDANLFL